MRSKKEIEKDVQNIKKGIEELKEKNSHLSSMVGEKVKNDEINSNLFSLIKYLIDENKRTTMILQNLAQGINRLENELFNDAEPSQAVEEVPQFPIAQGAKEIPISDLDARILQIIQRKGMACADDIKANLNYKGRNAASARLSKLYKEGLLSRYQLGHKVFYKFDAGKATNTLIISPPQ
jgi:predicted nuclease of restriction endonuclease-like RecB superfamily